MIEKLITNTFDNPKKNCFPLNIKCNLRENIWMIRKEQWKIHTNVHIVIKILQITLY